MRVRALGLAAVVMASLWAPALANAATIVPGFDANVEGNSNNGFPFNAGAFGQASMRYQQVYDASAFTGPIWIDEIWFRPDGETGSAFASNLSSIRIDLSTTGAIVDGLSDVFANNIGADNTTVYNGALLLSSLNTGSGPRDFDIRIVLATRFLYNPAFGNLLLDVRNFGGGLTTQFDAEASFDAVSRVFSFDTDVNARTGLIDSTGLVTRFSTTAVPEPATFVLLGGGLVALVVRRRLSR